MRRVARLFSLFAVAVGAFALVAATASTASAPGTEIAFVSGSLTPEEPQLIHADIYLVHPNGSGLRDITASMRGDELAPSWSPDGRRIAFLKTDNNIRSYSLWVMSADGSRQHNVFGPLGTAPICAPGCASAVAPSWSPDGKWIAFARPERATHIWAIRPNGSGLHRITSGRPSQWTAAWSPNGRSLAYFEGKRPAPSSQGAIKVLDLSNHRSRRIASADLVGSIAWSPAGNVLAFGQPVGSAVTGGIYVVRSDGSGLRRVAPGWEPSWVTSSTIAFAATNGSDTGTRLAVIDSNGTNQSFLTKTAYPADDEYPASTRARHG